MSFSTVDPPAGVYRPSPRPYTGRVPPMEYPGHFLLKRGTNAGTFRLHRRLLARLDERDYVLRG